MDMLNVLFLTVCVNPKGMTYTKQSIFSTKYHRVYKNEDARKHPLICCFCPFKFRTQFTSE